MLQSLSLRISTGVLSPETSLNMGVGVRNSGGRGPERALNSFIQNWPNNTKSPSSAALKCNDVHTFSVHGPSFDPSSAHAFPTPPSATPSSPPPCPPHAARPPPPARRRHRQRVYVGWNLKAQALSGGQLQYRKARQSVQRGVDCVEYSTERRCDLYAQGVT
jgi:hypothetical protein